MNTPETQTNGKNAPAALAPATGSRVPDGYELLSPSDEICVGDIVADCEGKWRGPVEYNWPGCGCLVSDYTTSKSGIGLPACRGVARKQLQNVAMGNVAMSNGTKA